MDLSTRLDGVKRGLMTVEKNEVGANELKPLSEAVDKDRGRSLRAFTLGAGGLDSRRRVLDLKKWMTCTPETEIILN